MNSSLFRVSVVLLSLGLSGCSSDLPLGDIPILPRQTEITDQTDYTTPPIIQFSTEVYRLVRGAEISPIEPLHSGGTPQNCRSTPQLPGGLTIDPETCAISGRPYSLSPNAQYLIVAENASGTGESLVRLEIVAPPSLSLEPENAVIAPGTTTLVRAKGGYGTTRIVHASGGGKIVGIDGMTVEYYADAHLGAATLTVEDDAGQFTEATIEIIPPQIETLAQQLQLDAARADGVIPPRTGCAQKQWHDVGGRSSIGQVLGFSKCGSSRGWNGDGTAANPYRLSFDSSSAQKVVLTDRDEQRPEQISVEAWFRPKNFSGWYPIAMKSESMEWSDGYGLYLNPKQELVFFVNGWENPETLTKIDVSRFKNTWMHAVGSYDGQILKLYVNGVLVAQRDYAVSINHTRSDLQVGSLSGYTFNGDIASVNLYSRALSAKETRLNCLTRRGRYEGASCGNMIVTPETRTMIEGRTYRTELYAGVRPYTATTEKGDAKTVRASSTSFFVTAPTSRQHVRIRYTDALGYSRSQVLYTLTRVPEVADGLTLKLDAMFRTGESSPQLSMIPGSDCKPTSWRDLTAAKQFASLRGYNDCGLHSGWNGEGSLGDPYRLEFDGRDDDVEIAHHSSQQPRQITVEAWFRARSGTGTRPLIVKTSNSDWENGYGLYLKDNRVAFFVNERKDSETVAPVPTYGEYTHAVASYDGAVVRLYLNGRLVTVRPYTQALKIPKVPIRIGSAPGIDTNYGGALVKVATYARALPSEEIRQNCLALQQRFLDSVMCW